MAWKEVNVYDQRKLFITKFLEKNFGLADLCRQFEISRPTAYKWIERYKEEGFDGLIDRSSAPQNQIGETAPQLIKEILKVKFNFPKWGPKKILAFLQMHQPLIIWPSVTTIGNILQRNGLVILRKYRKRFPAKTDPLSHANQSNDVWSIDFKGWFLTKDNAKCGPLTIMDNFSRFLLRCIRLEIDDTDHVWAILDTVFREYGLPNYLRSDNGPPFATGGAGRLSRLSVKLIKAGVIPEWIEPGNPQENGRHERMHGTLQMEGVFPQLTAKKQQIKFMKFEEYYNWIRPHEALSQKTPGSIYITSKRIWNGKLKSPEYPDEYKKVRVHSCGKMFWKGQQVYIGRTLSEENVGLKEDLEGGFTVYFGPIILGTLTRECEFIITRREARKKSYKQQLSKKEV